MPYHGEDDYCGGPTFKLTQWGNTIITEDLRSHLVRIGADWQTEIQAAIDALTAGRTWMEKVEVWAQRITLNASIDLIGHDLTSLYIHGELYLADGVNAPLIDIDDGATGTTDLDIFVEIANGNRAGNPNVDVSQVICGRYVDRMTAKVLYAHDVQGEVVKLRDSDWNHVEVLGGTDIVNPVVGISWGSHNTGLIKGIRNHDDDLFWLQGDSKFNDFTVNCEGGKDTGVGSNLVRIQGSIGNVAMHNYVKVVGEKANVNGVHLTTYTEHNHAHVNIEDLDDYGILDQGDRNILTGTIHTAKQGIQLQGTGTKVDITIEDTTEHGILVQGEDHEITARIFGTIGWDGIRMDGADECIVNAHIRGVAGGGRFAITEVNGADWNIYEKCNVRTNVGGISLVGGGGNSVKGDGVLE